MRAFFLLLALIAVAGCTGTRNGQRTESEQTAHDTPIITENPRLLDRLRFNRQQKAAQAGTDQARIELEGNVSH